LHAFAERFHHPIGMVTSEEINRFVHEIKGVKGRPTNKKGASPPEPVSGRTKNNYIQAINVLFEYAKKQKYLPRDHDVLDNVESAAESDFVIEIFTPEELEKLLKHADEALVPVLALGAFAGLRTAEIERLEWPEVNLARKLIEVKAHKAKTRARRLVPITKNLAACLKPHAAKEGKVWPHSAPYLFELQAEAAKGAGVEWKHNALRHSFISYRLAIVKNVDQVAMEAGNSAQMIFQHYRELVTEENAAAWFGLGLPAKVKAKAGKQKKQKTAAKAT
jgi:integrase